MKPDTKAQVKSAAKTSAVVAGALGIGIIALQLFIPQPPKKLYLRWDMGGEMINGTLKTATVTDVWMTTNLVNMVLIGSVTNTNVFQVPNVGPRGFFRVSHRVRPDGTIQ